MKKIVYIIMGIILVAIVGIGIFFYSSKGKIEVSVEDMVVLRENQIINKELIKKGIELEKKDSEYNRIISNQQVEELEDFGNLFRTYFHVKIKRKYLNDYFDANIKVNTDNVTDNIYLLQSNYKYLLFSTSEGALSEDGKEFEFSIIIEGFTKDYSDKELEEKLRELEFEIDFQNDKGKVFTHKFKGTEFGEVTMRNGEEVWTRAYLE